ncbi:MAG: tRNA (guanosine(46)-N7)-methyltransferase TrmB [Oscillospiraceae bacterium]
MRMRRKPWARPELEACPFFIDDPPSMLGTWHSAFVRCQQPLILELGCGKGGFIAHEAAVNPQNNYLAVDIKSEVLALAKRHIDDLFSLSGRKSIDNIFVMSWDIERIDSILDNRDPISAIYINFPNPWPKNRHKKKRLTHIRQLLKYREFLSENGEVFFKTDDDELFEDSLGYFEAAGFYIEEANFDCYEQGVPDNSTLTEHEAFFIKKSLPIHFIKAKKGDLL